MNMPKTLQIETIKRSLPQGFDPQTIDFEHEIDGSLTLPENKRILQEKYPLVFPHEINILELKHLEAESYMMEAQNMEKELEKSIEKIKTDCAPDLDRHYAVLKDFVDVSQKSKDIHGLIIYGEPSLGKTRYTLMNAKGQVVLIAGHITPKKFYMTLIKNPKATIVIDDPSDIFENKDTYSLLLQALQTEDERIVQWQSSKDDKDVVPKGKFAGKIIITCNYLPNDHIILSRCFVKELKFSFEERMEILYEFSKKQKIPTEIMDYVKTISNLANAKRLHFRFLLKAYDFYKRKKDWKEFCKVELETDPMLDLVLQLSRTSQSVKEQVKAFVEKSGYSERSFYNFKKELQN